LTLQQPLLASQAYAVSTSVLVLRTANAKASGARLGGAERFAPSRLRKFDFNFLSQA